MLPGSTLVRASSSDTTRAPRSAAGTSLNCPPYRPTGVRRGSQTTTSLPWAFEFSGTAEIPFVIGPPLRPFAQFDRSDLGSVTTHRGRHLLDHVHGGRDL